MPKRNDTKQKKGGGTPAPPPPAAGDALGYSAQLQEMYGSFRDILGSLKTQRSQLRGAFRTQRQAIGSALQQNLAGAENAAIERGVLGSSGDFQSRVAVRGQAATMRAEARNAFLSGKLANTAQAQQAYRDMRMGLIGLQSQKRAQAAMASAADAFTETFGAPPPPTPTTGPGFSNPPAPTGGGSGGGNGLGGPFGGPGPVDDPKLDPEQKARLEKMQQGILKLVDRYAGTTDTTLRGDLYAKLIALWKKRNTFRAGAGFDPVKRARLEQLIAAARAEDTGPGGQI